MAGGDRERAFDLLRRGDPQGALPLLLSLLRDNPGDANVHHLVGTCFRSLNRVPEAVHYLKRSTELSPGTGSYWLALGISLQLAEDFTGAIAALKAALEIDPDYALAFNSLALTQKKMGDLDNALHNYDGGVKALARNIVNGFSNSASNPILKNADTRGRIWLEYSMYGAMHLSVQEGDIKAVAWPTGEQAMEEERTEKHGGLYWTPCRNDEGEEARLFLPNYFNTFRETLRVDRAYADLIGNRGVVLKMLGRENEAQEHLSEAEEFAGLL